MKIYTKTGDKGETALVSGSRVPKSDLRIDLYGDVDELNSYIGFLLSSVKNELLAEVQSALFCLGSQLACEVENRAKYKLPSVPPALIEKLEASIDEMDQKLPALKNFILPGGDEAASRAHLCRVLTRKVERKLVKFGRDVKDEVPVNSIEFLNRLSDFFFVYARYLNLNASSEEVIWKA